MPKHEFIISWNVAGVETEVNAVAVYDIAHEYLGILMVQPEYKTTVEVYEVYVLVGLDRPNIYLDGLLSDAQYLAIENEIKLSLEV